MGDRIWVLTCVRECSAHRIDQEQLVEIDASSGAVVRRLPTLTNVSAFTTAGRSVWVAHFLNGDVTRLDPVSGRVITSVHLRLPVPVARDDRHFLPEGLSAAHGYVWASTARGRLAQIDARTGRLVRMVRTPSEDNTTTSDRYGTWVAEDLGGIGRLAPNAKRLGIHAIMQAALPLDVYAVLGGGGVVWALADPDTLNTAIGASARTIAVLIDPRTDRIIHRVRVPVTDYAGAVVSGGALYLGDLAQGHIYRVSRGGALRTFVTPHRRAGLVTSSPGALWAAMSATPRHNRTQGSEPGRLLRISLPLR